MIFEANQKADLSKIAVSEVIEQISLIDFLEQREKYKRVVTCPVNALDLENNSINLNCNDCGLCWIANEKIINKKGGVPDYNKFKRHVFRDKMFIYRWLSLSLSNYSGIEISSAGFSRNKRIPLIVKKNKILYFVKAIRDFADIETAKLELLDIMDLSKDIILDYKKKIIAVIIDEYGSYPNPKQIIKIKLKELYDKIIAQGKTDITELI